jgi:phosphoribosyl-ATP pyrophosphohydrolase
MRAFNITGPCRPDRHYMLPPLERSPMAMRLVQGENYLAVSGPRQSGKTSLLKALVDRINADGWARAVLLSCEAAGLRQSVTDTGEAELRLLEVWHRALCGAFPAVLWPATEPYHRLVPGGRFDAAFTEWTSASGLPLVVVLDEVDTLARAPFVSLLAQIRSSFERRGRTFPASIVLAGMRSLRDHDVALGGDGSGSPFNIVRDIVVKNFTRDEVVRLYAQHTADTGQRFTDEALETVWAQTRGQPLLVNALADLAVTQLVPEASQAIEASHIEEAIRLFEASNPIHLTSLAKRLSEDRVMNVVAPVVVGDAPNVSSDDLRYATELGLLERGTHERLEPANPIYARALLKLVTSREREALLGWTPQWLDEAGRVDVVRLRENFLAFWELHRDMMRNRIHYEEAVAHFGLMTYLDRVANGGGYVAREFAVGRGRLDLLLVHRELRLPIEVKVHRDRGGDPEPEGLQQLERYCRGLGVAHGWLVVFDQRSTATGKRLEHEVVTADGRSLFVVRA